jgi:hypothetical protein
MNRLRAWSIRWSLPVALAGVVAATLPGCGRSPTAPEPGPARVPIEGTWTGSITDRTGVTAQVSMTLSGLDTLGVGTFSITFADPAANVSGVLQGRTQNAPTIDLSLFVQSGGRDCSAPGVSYAARLALSDNRMTGTYQPAVGCSLLAGGSMELTRR